MPRYELNFATLNLYNLQLPGQSMYGGKKYSQAQYDAKIRWTAELLKKLDADVIGFQELWHPDALKDAFQSANLLLDYTLLAKHFPGKIGTALAVRAPHTVVEKNGSPDADWIEKFPSELVLRKREPGPRDAEPDYAVSVEVDNFSRGLLRAVFKPRHGNKRPPNVVVYVAHLKSKLPMRLDREEYRQVSVKKHVTAIGSALSTIRRTAEAAALRVLLTNETKGSKTPVAVLGDLNDSQLSVTTSIVSGDPSYRPFFSSRRGRSSDAGFYAAATLQEYRSLRDVYYTHVHAGRKESLDHILVSEQFYDYSSNRKWTFKEMRIHNDYLDDDDASTSDHAAVSARFVYDPA